MRERARAAGWKVDEVCDCEQPEIVFGGGDGWYLTACWRCRKRPRQR